MELQTKKSEDFSRVAFMLREHIDSFQVEGALLVALYGDLGAGKTTLTQYLGKLFDIEETMQSPTFTIMKMYPIEDERFSRLIHIDAYRIEDISELQVLGFHRLVSDPKNLILLEWPERVGDLLPDKRLDVHIAYDGEGRRVEITGKP